MSVQPDGGRFQVGSRVGNFVVESLLGEGAMGAVYLAQHDTLRRKVAIKVLLPALAADRGLVERFIDEARVVSGLGHPGVVQVLDFGTLPDGRRYSVMEYLQGEDLEHVLRREGRMEPWRVARLGAQIADALAVAHEAGVVHRDLKPANLFVTRDASGEEQIKILDFGIAKLLGDGEVTRTKAGTVMGTPQYLSPEQASGRTDLDGRSDMYSLGVCLYEMLAGRPPFVSNNTIELLMNHAKDPAPPLLGLAPATPPALAAIVMRCLEKDRAARFTSARELRVSVLALGVGQLPGQTNVSTAALAPAVARGGSKKGLVAVIVLALVGAAVAAIVLSGGGKKGKGAGAGTPPSGSPSASPSASGSPGASASPSASASPAASPGGPSLASRNPFRADDAQAIAAGAAIWTSKCARCHGQSGEGDGKDTPPGLEPKSFADAHAVPGLLDLYRFEIIRRGVEQDGKQTMPAFADLSEDDTWKLVTFIATLAPPMPAGAAALAPRAPKPALDSALQKRGAQLYKLKCASCHGKRGKGDGPAREFLGRFPADLTAGVYKLRSTPKGLLPTDEDIFATLTAGMGVGGMPAFAKLPELDRWALVAHVESLSSRFAKQKDAPEIVTVPPRPAPSDAARERGKKAYAAAGCPQCHGDSGRGDGPKAAELKDARGNPVKPSDFTAPFTWISGSAPEQLYRTMMTGVGGTPMPQGSDFFSDSEGWDVVEYLLSLAR